LYSYSISAHRETEFVLAVRGCRGHLWKIEWKYL